MGPDCTRTAARIGLVAIAIGIAVAWPQRAEAAPKRSFSVEVTPPGWRADALAQTLATDLSDDQLAAHAPPAELAVRVELVADAIRYDLAAQWPGAPPPVHGTLALGPGLDRVGLAGVLRDRLHRMARTSTDDTAEATAALELPGAGAIAIALLAIGLVLASPFVLGRDRRVMLRVAGSFAIGCAAAVLGLVA